MARDIHISNKAFANPGTSGWNAILAPATAAQELASSRKADIVIIGGGFAGLAAARRLSLQAPELEVVLLEACRIGEGPTGRSSGFMIEVPHDLSSDSYAGASERDARQTAMNRSALAFAEAASEEFGFSKEVFDRRGKLNAAASPKGDQHNQDYAAHLERMGEAVEILSAQDMQGITGTNYYLSALYTPGSAMIQPAAFVRQLARGIAPKVDIFENSPVLSLKRQEQSYLVQTPKGQVEAEQVILAVNGHLQSFGFLPNRLMHIMLYASMTRALTPQEVQTLGGHANWDIVPADPMGSTIRRISGTGGDRIVVRNKFHFSSSLDTPDKTLRRAAKDHRRSFDARFPMLKAVDMEYMWGGRLCLSWNSVPVFGEIAEGIIAACCQNGLGASKGVLSGMLAADLACGIDNPYIKDYSEVATPSRLPPEPLASLGANSYLMWKEWRAGREK